MTAAVPRKRGRPPTGRALSAAERARRYRTRLRIRGMSLRSSLRRDPLLSGVNFRSDTWLSPGEQDVLRRFCRGFGKLPRLPEWVAVFGSRARGDSHARSDLDVAVCVDAPRSPGFESMLSAIAFDAQRRYWIGEYGIALRPVPFFRAESTALLDSVRDELERVWTKPR